jgi:hypothetical protein
MINNHKDWLVEYRKDKSKVWIICKAEDGRNFYFTEYDGWYELQNILSNENLRIDKVKLQYRSNVIEESLLDYDGVYIVRSLLGSPGQDTVKTLTIGKVRENVVEKTVWILKGLVQENKYEDTIENCFEEGLYIWNKN